MSNDLEKLIAVFMAPMQRLENAMIQVRDGYDVDTAVGVQLEVLGKLVGQGRGGLDDDTYRRYIRARIAANRSAGKREEILNITRLVLGTDAGTVWIRCLHDASLIIEIRDLTVDPAVAKVLVQILSASVAVGVRFEVETSTRLLASLYRLDSGPGLNVGHLAAGDDNS